MLINCPRKQSSMTKAHWPLPTWAAGDAQGVSPWHCAAAAARSSRPSARRRRTGMFLCVRLSSLLSAGPLPIRNARSCSQICFIASRLSLLCFCWQHTDACNCVSAHSKNLLFAADSQKKTWNFCLVWWLFFPRSLAQLSSCERFGQ